MDLGNLLMWIIVGGIGGWLGGLVMKVRMGLVGTIIIGIVGGLIGGFVLSALNIGGPVTGLNIGSIIVAFIGSIILIALVRFLRRV